MEVDASDSGEHHSNRPHTIPSPIGVRPNHHPTSPVIYPPRCLSHNAQFTPLHNPVNTSDRRWCIPGSNEQTVNGRKRSVEADIRCTNRLIMLWALLMVVLMVVALITVSVVPRVDNSSRSKQNMTESDMVL